MNKQLMAMVTVSMMIIIIGSGSFLSIANGQPQTTNTAPIKKPLPVLLIYGYASDASVWSKWEDLLKKDRITFYPITFYKSDDKCGSAADHAKCRDYYCCITLRKKMIEKMKGEDKSLDQITLQYGGS